MRIHLIAVVLIGCSSSGKPVEPGPPPTTGFRYFSDCSLTNPVARDPCEGPSDTRGLQRCETVKVKAGDACASEAAPGCYNEIACPDGHRAVSEYLVCASDTPGRCLTRSSRRFKHDIEYVSRPELAELAQQIEALRLARFRYVDQPGSAPRLGFLTEDAAGAPFVSSDGRTVDLYALLSASIAAIQIQDARIRVLEEQLRSASSRSTCAPDPRAHARP